MLKTIQYIRICSVLMAIIILSGCSSYEIPSYPDNIGLQALENARRIIYVSSDGSNEGNGSRARPLASVQKGVAISQKGDAIKVMPGVYTENISLRSNISLIGSGADVTILTAGEGSIIVAEGVSNVLIEGFTLDGKDGAVYGLYCRDLPSNQRGGIYAMQLTFRNNVVKNSIGYGIWGDRTSVIIENNKIYSHGADAIRLINSVSRILGNTISHAQAGIYLHSGGTRIENNTIHQVQQNSICCFDLEWTMVTHNRIYDAGESGIKCEGRSPVVKYNFVTQSLWGIRCQNSAPKIRSNIIRDNEFGIFIDSGSRPDIGREDDPGNNSIFNNTKSDIYNESNNVITAVGNWWGNSFPSQDQFYGNVNYSGALKEGNRQPEGIENKTPFRRDS